MSSSCQLASRRRVASHELAETTCPAVKILQTVASLTGIQVLLRLAPFARCFGMFLSSSLPMFLPLKRGTPLSGNLCDEGTKRDRFDGSPREY